MIKRTLVPKRVQVLHLIFGIFIIATPLSEKLLGQTIHTSGFYSRYIMATGFGQIDDIIGNATLGSANYASFAMGLFPWENIALHAGADYTAAYGLKYDGNRVTDISASGDTTNEPRRRGSYNYQALTAGLSYYWTSLNFYVSTEFRLAIGGDFHLKGSIDEINGQSTSTRETSNITGNFRDEENLLGLGIILGTEEWFITKDMGLGIALVFNYDYPLRQSFYGLGLSLSYN